MNIEREIVDSVYRSVGGSVWRSASNSVSDYVWRSASNSVWDSMRVSVGVSVRSTVDNSINEYGLYNMEKYKTNSAIKVQEKIGKI